MEAHGISREDYFSKPLLKKSDKESEKSGDKSSVSGSESSEAAAPVKAKTPEAKNLLQQRTPSKPPAVQAAALSNVLSQFSAARETGKYEKEKD